VSFLCRIARRTLVYVTSMCLAFASLANQSFCQGPAPSQIDVETVYLFNFAKFVRWPAERDGEQLNICIAAQKAYSDSASRVVAGEQIGTRRLAVKLVSRPEDVSGCAILFVGLAAKDHLNDLLNAAAQHATLTVSDIPGFLEQRGMISLFVVNNRVRFSVNLENVDRSGLSLSSELLKVAVQVQGKSPGVGAR